MPRLLLLPFLVLGIATFAIGEDSQAAPPKRTTPSPSGTEVTISAAAEGVLKVRLQNVPGGGFDEKGNIKNMSAAEKLKAKGDTAAEQRLPGYKGTVSQLNRGDMVTVTLSAAKPDPMDQEKMIYSSSGKPPISGKLVSADAKQIVVQVTGTYPSGPGAKKDSGNKYTVPDTTAATMVVVTQEAPSQTSGKPPKNKKDK